MASIIAGLVGGLTGGGSGSSGGNPNSPGFTPYVPTGLGATDTGWQGMFQGLMGELEGSYGGGTGTTVPMMNRALTGMEGVNWASPTNDAPSQYLTNMQNAANTAGQQYGDLSTQSNNMANIMQEGWGNNNQAINALQGAAGQLWNTASDPNQAIYNNLLQQTDQQANAGTAMRGIGMSPEAAGIQQQADQSLNLGWQQQQLQNQLAGAQGISGLYSQAGQQGVAGNQALMNAQQMNALTPQFLQQSASTPYNMAMQNAETPLTMANLMAQANMQDVQNPLQSLMGAAIPYMNYGAGAQQGAANVGLQNQGNFAGMGGSLANYFNQFQNPFNTGTSSGGSPFTPGQGSYVPYDPSGDYG